MTDPILEAAVARLTAMSAGNKSWAPNAATSQHEYDLRHDAGAIDTALSALATQAERIAYLEAEFTRPVTGIENRAAEEVFAIMSSRGLLPTKGATQPAAPSHPQTEG